jgi:membrane protease subunit HflK
MPWSNNNGGGGGPWQPRNNGPWGNGPSGGGGGGGGGNRPPDLEDLLRKGQDRLRSAMPGGNMSGMGILCCHRAGRRAGLAGDRHLHRATERGRHRAGVRPFRSVASPGLNYNWPYPIGRVDKPTVGGAVGRDRHALGRLRSGAAAACRQESLMLTGDENIVDIDFTVLWRIDEKRPQDFIFNLRNNEPTVKAVAEAAMREMIGKSNALMC